MEGERGVPNYELQVSFTNTPHNIQEIGFAHFEENQVLGFMSPSSQSQSSQLSHNELVTKTSWNQQDQVV